MANSVIRVWLAWALVTSCQSERDRATVASTASSTVPITATTTPATGAIRGGPAEALVTAPWVDTKAVFDTTLDAPNFQCAPKVFTTRDTITLRAEIPHGGWLIVAAPDSTIFELTSPSFIHFRGFPPLIDPDAFKETLILRFRADVKTKASVYGRDTLETVFRLPGEYVFTIGENLATEYDEEDPNWHCSIRLSRSP